MGQILGKTFVVKKLPKTKGSISVGYYDTKQEAKDAMIEHYKNNSKRGKFCYSISEERLEDCGGYIMHSFTSGDYYTRYTQEQLKYMV